MSGTKITPDERAAMRETIATLDAAWEADDPTRPLVTEHAALALLAHVASAVPRLLDALDTADAEVALLRAEIRRDLARFNGPTRSTPARPAPVWDEDTAALAVFERSHEPPFEDSEEGMREAKRFVRSLAVVREHLPVFAADIDGLAFAIFEHSHEPSLPDDQGGREEARSRALDYIQMYVEQGESRATVQAEALRDAAEEIDRLYFGPDQDRPFSTGARHKWGAMQAAERLRARIDRLDKGADRG